MIYATDTKHQWVGADGRTLHYSERTDDGRYWACNMRWSVRNRNGLEIYRGPARRARSIVEGGRLTLGEAFQAAERF